MLVTDYYNLEDLVVADNFDAHIVMVTNYGIDTHKDGTIVRNVILQAETS